MLRSKPERWLRTSRVAKGEDLLRINPGTVIRGRVPVRWEPPRSRQSVDVEGFGRHARSYPGALNISGRERSVHIDHLDMKCLWLVPVIGTHRVVGDESGQRHTGTRCHPITSQRPVLGKINAAVVGHCERRLRRILPPDVASIDERTVTSLPGSSPTIESSWG